MPFYGKFVFREVNYKISYARYLKILKNKKFATEFGIKCERRKYTAKQRRKKYSTIKNSNS